MHFSVGFAFFAFYAVHDERNVVEILLDLSFDHALESKKPSDQDTLELSLNSADSSKIISENEFVMLTALERMRRVFASSMKFEVEIS